MKRRIIQGLIALSLATPSVASAQAPTPPAQPKKDAAEPKKSEITTLPIVVDLAGSASQAIKVDAGTYQLTLMNAVPGRSYWLHIGPSFAQEIPVLSAEGIKFTPFESPGLPAEAPCPLKAAIDRLIASPKEIAVRKNVESLRIEAATASTATCEKELEVAAKVMEATSIALPNSPIIISGNAVRRVSISSRDGGHWDVELNSMGRGTWQTTYGLAFSPNEDEEYFSEAGADAEFTIRKKARDSGSLTFLPAVFFTWLPSSQALRNIQHGPTLGLGVTAGDAGGRFGALAGYTVRFNQNIGLLGGLSVYKHRRLDAQYTENQIIKENLAPDKLNKDSLRPNAFLALILRLGSSPFAASAKPAEPKAK